jgi:hypothetical protein
MSEEESSIEQTTCTDPSCQSACCETSESESESFVRSIARVPGLAKEADKQKTNTYKKKRIPEPEDPSKQVCSRCCKQREPEDFQEGVKQYKNCKICRERQRASHQKRLDGLSDEDKVKLREQQKERRLKYKQTVSKLLEMHPEVKAQLEETEKKKKEPLPPTVDCECGQVVKRCSLAAHRKTKKHCLAVGLPITPDEVKECECGAKINARGFKKHQESKIHINALNAKQRKITKIDTTVDDAQPISEPSTDEE